MERLGDVARSHCGEGAAIRRNVEERRKHCSQFATAGREICPTNPSSDQIDKDKHYGLAGGIDCQQ
jgi:hypothetical protein